MSNLSAAIVFLLIFVNSSISNAAITNPQGFMTCDNPATFIQQNGIVWTFAAPVKCGQFVNGDYWVVGPVIITGITPGSYDDGTGHILNGSQINPDPSSIANTQGYDSKMGYMSYDPALNVAMGVTIENPLVVANGSSLISTKTATTGGTRPQIEDAAVLTVLASAPAIGSFRPPYTGTDKTITHNESEIDYSHLQKLTPTASAPSIATATSYFSKVWLDYVVSAGGGMTHPKNHMPDYGRDMSARIGEVALLLNCNFTNEQKRDIMIGFLQYGLDLWGTIKAGFGGWWMLGGHGPGRKFPILFAGVILGDTGMAAVGSLPLNKPAFGEDETTFYLDQYTATRYIGADGKYPTDNLHRDYPDAYYTTDDWNFVNPNGKKGIPEYLKTLGYGYEARWISKRLDASYRECCHVNGFTGWILAVYAMGLKEEWNHDALFDYTDRYLKWTKAVGNPEWTRHWSKFNGEMWDKYRENYQ